MADVKQQEKEFYCELVNRFFNENSYFFHCINHELDGVLTETKDVDNEIYLMLGNFFDKLISKEDVAAELESLKQGNEFFEFVDKLEQSVSFLHNNELDTERMKIEIEGLAHSMFNSALLAFQTPSTTTQSKNYLNNDEVGSEKIKETGISELSSTEPVNVESGIFSDETESLKESQGNADEKDFHLEAELDKDVRLTGGLNNRRSIEDSSDIPLKDKHLTPQPASFLSVFIIETKQKIDSLNKIVQKKNITNKSWKESTDIIDSIMMSSVIYGFEAYEQIAVKSKKQLKKYISSAQFKEARVLLEGTIDNLNSLVEKNDPENVNQTFIKNATEKLLTSQNNQSESSVAALTVEKTVHPEKKRPTKQAIEISDDIAPPQDVIQIKIPGEDDEEIHSLIAEISKESALIQPAWNSEQTVTPEPRFETEEAIRVNAPKPVEDKTFSLYRQQAELYFSVIEEALITLERQRRNKTALEDLELASNALYGLSLKLNLDPIGKFPDLILTLIKNILATNYTITEKDHALISKGFSYFKSLGNLEELDEGKFNEIIKAIISFDKQVKNQASHDADFMAYPPSGRIGFA